MSDVTAMRLLADELGTIAAAVPGVARVQARPGMGRLARRVLSGITGGPGAPGQPDVVIEVGQDATVVELDVVIDSAHAAPDVVRVVAANVRARLALEELPPASVDVRVVSLV